MEHANAKQVKSKCVEILRKALFSPLQVRFQSDSEHEHSIAVHPPHKAIMFYIFMFYVFKHFF